MHSSYDGLTKGHTESQRLVLRGHIEFISNGWSSPEDRPAANHSYPQPVGRIIRIPNHANLYQ